MQREKENDMTPKEKLLKEIHGYLEEQKATQKSKKPCEIYLYRGEQCNGKMLSVWNEKLLEKSRMRCKVNWWGILCEMPLEQITVRNLTTLRDYLRDGSVIQ